MVHTSDLVLQCLFEVQFSLKEFLHFCLFLFVRSCPVFGYFLFLVAGYICLITFIPNTVSFLALRYPDRYLLRQIRLVRAKHQIARIRESYLLHFRQPVLSHDKLVVARAA